MYALKFQEEHEGVYAFENQELYEKLMVQLLLPGNMELN